MHSVSKPVFTQGSHQKSFLRSAVILAFLHVYHNGNMAIADLTGSLKCMSCKDPPLGGTMEPPLTQLKPPFRIEHTEQVLNDG